MPLRHRCAGASPCRTRKRDNGMLQWQGITGNAAVVEGERRRDAVQKVYSRMTVTSRAPWAPMTRACSMSAVLEGPAMKLPKS